MQLTKRTVKKTLGYFWHYSALLLMVAFTAFPLVWALAFGLSSDASMAYLFPDGFFPHQDSSACTLKAGSYCLFASDQPGQHIGFSLDWFQRVFQEMPFLTYLKNSLIMSVMSIVGVLLVSVLAAYPLARMDFPGRKVIFIAIVTTMMLPSEVGIVPNFIIIKKFGDWANALQALLYGGDWLAWLCVLVFAAALLLAAMLVYRQKAAAKSLLLLAALAFVAQALLMAKVLAWQPDAAAGGDFWRAVQPGWAAIAHTVFGSTQSPASWSGWVGLDSHFAAVVPNFATAFGIFLMKQAFEAIPQDLIDAARVDGASEMQILWLVMVPVTAPAIAALSIFTLVSAWNDYLWPSIVINTKEKLPVAVGVFNDLTGPFATSDNLLMAAIILTVLPVLVFFAFTQRFFISGMDGAVK
ncbi:carbohydrate ABC transporter permease [Chitinibacter sp. GC72]|uniref:carbohydrate ABC transporter permease n=1 Tax=Chitinibacter sp. GC72 TaxID=1526917 RepID=UPI0012FCED51|nr:carbohydrate ABC transporter permease [Chitinibacter sp. GC72]